MPKIKTVRGIENRKVVSQKDWLVARKKLLMKKLIVALLSAAGIALGSASAADSSNAAKGEKKEAVTEALVRQRVEDWAKAVRAKDIDGVMSLYATNNVSFDLDPPLRYAGLTINVGPGKNSSLHALAPSPTRYASSTSRRTCEASAKRSA